MSDAVPLPPRPNLEQYKKLARDLQQACKAGPDAVRAWITDWIDGLAAIASAQERERGAGPVIQRWEQFREGKTDCTLTGCQFFLAREHGFKSWPKFARHVEGLA